MMSPTTTDGQRALSTLQRLLRVEEASLTTTQAPKLPATSTDRLTITSTEEKTILYLAYGSNLSAETFKGTRGIRPLSAVNAHIPSLNLTFDLPGIPYLEPCFANTAYRNPFPTPTDYHKDRWHKGLIGVVYEVTPEDYRTIIATAGAGASYPEVLVECYALGKGLKDIEEAPKGKPFMAHTLLQPRDADGKLSKGSKGPQRPDPSYAQASARYLKLITDGGEEHELPATYMTYLYNIRPYAITTTRQTFGQAFFLATWSPLILGMMAVSKLFLDENGLLPAWIATILAFVFNIAWISYDAFYKRIFGDGERTIGDTDHDESALERGWDEKRGEWHITI